MAYTTTNKKLEHNITQDDMLASKRFVVERKPEISKFYELEEAVVLDVILDENHPVFGTDAKNSYNTNLAPELWPPNIDGSRPKAEDKNYSWIGRIKFRFLNSQEDHKKEYLDWAYPIENTGIVEYPLMNEIVIVGQYGGKYFYSRKLNVNSTINCNANFISERVTGNVEKNINEFSRDGNYIGPVSKITFDGGDDYQGILGSYFKFNNKIRSLKHFEGDTIIESRFGSSIRFGAYDDSRGNDNGVGEYGDQGGNPMILIRNRQAPIKSPQGYTGKGYTLEDINKDGSSIHMTSGKTVSRFVPPVTSVGMINVTKGITPPPFNGDQIIFNSDRLVFSARANEILFYSKKIIGMATDSALSLNSYGNTTITSNKGIITLNAPKIYLNFNPEGANDQPVLLGRTTVLWMYALCDWMLLSVNNQIQTLTTLLLFCASHIHGSAAGPTTPPLPVTAPMLIAFGEQLQSAFASQISLTVLRSQLSALMSSRTFVGG